VPAHIPRPDYADHRTYARDEGGYLAVTDSSPPPAEGESAIENEENMNEAMQMRKPSRLYAAKVHTPEEIAGMREACKASPCRRGCPIVGTKV
jgi:hypothetical protein